MNKISAILILSIFIVSCSSFKPERIAPNYFKAYTNIKGSLFGYEDHFISRDFVQKIPYASMYLKIGKGSAGLLILEEILGKNLIYVSADNIRLVLKDGKIIRSSGLENNLMRIKEPRDSFNNFLKSQENETSYYAYYSYDHPKLIDMRVSVNLKKVGMEEITILGFDYSLIKVEEYLENNYLGWKVKNIYWIDSKDYYVWKSHQYISPLLPDIRYEITKKPSI